LIIISQEIKNRSQERIDMFKLNIKKFKTINAVDDTKIFFYNNLAKKARRL